MPPRKARIAVVLDTNVVVGYYLSRRLLSTNSRVFRLWRDERKLQLIISAPIMEEYLEVLVRLKVAERQIDHLAERLRRRTTVTHVQLGARPRASRDPDDNPILATAMAGRVKFLVTNDRDLLEIDQSEKRKFRFEIITPAKFLSWLRAENLNP